MALWQVTIPKHFLGDPEGQRWTNVYHVAADDASGAITAGEVAQNYEAGVHYATVAIGPVEVRQPGVPNSGRKGQTNTIGALPITGLGGSLPLFCTVRVDFLAEDATRAERKYLRLPGQQENTQDGGLWSEELTDFVQTNYADVISGMLSMRGPSGEPLGPGVVLRKIQMRQLDWHRRTRPGFHRGWVPDV